MRYGRVKEVCRKEGGSGRMVIMVRMVRMARKGLYGEGEGGGRFGPVYT